LIDTIVFVKQQFRKKSIGYDLSQVYDDYRIAADLKTMFLLK
jgi:hypothetical protein